MQYVINALCGGALGGSHEKPYRIGNYLFVCYMPNFEENKILEVYNGKELAEGLIRSERPLFTATGDYEGFLSTMKFVDRDSGLEELEPEGPKYSPEEVDYMDKLVIAIRSNDKPYDHYDAEKSVQARREVLK